MRKIEVKPNYDHDEWEIYFDGKKEIIIGGNICSNVALYSEGSNERDNITYTGLEKFVDDRVKIIQADVDVLQVPLATEELIELKNQLIEAWARHFGISEA